MKRLLYSIKMGIFVFKNPLIFQQGVLDMIKGIFNLVQKSHEEKRPFLTKMVIRNTDTKEDICEVFNLWIGIGEKADPIKRCGELAAENEALKLKLKEYEDREPKS